MSRITRRRTGRAAGRTAAAAIRELGDPAQGVQPRRHPGRPPAHPRRPAPTPGRISHHRALATPPCESSTVTASCSRPGSTLPVRDDHPGAGHHPGPAFGPSRRAPPPDQPAARSPPARPGQQKDQGTRIMASQPGQDWSGPNSQPAWHRNPRTCSPRSPSGPASVSSSKPAAAGTPGPVRPDRAAPPPAAPDRNPEIATTLLTSRQHVLRRGIVRATALRAALDSGDLCGPWRQEDGQASPPAARAARKPGGAGGLAVQGTDE